MYIRKPSSTIIRKLPNDEIFLVDIEKGRNITFNSSAFEFLGLLDERPRHIEWLVDSLSNKYGISYRDEIRKDAIELYSILASKELLIVGNDYDKINEYSLTTLQVEVTPRCNERCLHCYIPNLQKDKGAYIAVSLFESLISQFIDLGGKEITITGGEPFLHPQIFNLFEICKGNDLRINIFSNLNLLSENKIKYLRSLPIGTIQTSLYSLTPTLHDYITQIPGSLNRTLSSIEALAEEGLQIQIACPVMQSTLDGIEKIFIFAKEKHFGLRLNPLLTAKTDYDNRFVLSQRLTTKQITALYENLMEIDSDFAKTSVFETCDIDCELLQNPTEFINSPLCSAGMDHCCVSYNGDVYPCPDWDRFILGNIKSDSLEKIWYNSTAIENLRRLNRQKNFSGCLSCKALSFCKRCLMQNELEKQGDVLTCLQSTCDLAAVTQNLLYSNKYQQLRKKRYAY